MDLVTILTEAIKQDISKKEIIYLQEVALTILETISESGYIIVDRDHYERMFNYYKTGGLSYETAFKMSDER